MSEPLTLSRDELARLIGEHRIMASTAIQPAGGWKLQVDGRWQFVPDAPCEDYEDEDF